MPLKQLLVNADDFGLTEGITDGIIAAHQDGIVTSTSIIAGGSAFDYAVTRAMANQALGIGVHLTLVEERAVSDPRDISTLAGPNGKLPRSYRELLMGLLRGRVRGEHVELELRAQVLKCFKAGLMPTHLDSHQHLHTMPSILHTVVRIAEEFHIRGLRLARDLPPRRAAFWHNGYLPKTVLCMMARWDALSLRSQSFHICDRMRGLFESGGLQERQLLSILKQLPEGTTELVCHPGKADLQSRTAYGDWNYDWETELNALTSPAVRNMLRSQNIQLISYADLQRSNQNLPSPISSAGPVR